MSRFGPRSRFGGVDHATDGRGVGRVGAELEVSSKVQPCLRGRTRLLIQSRQYAVAVGRVGVLLDALGQGASRPFDSTGEQQSAARLQQ